MDHEPCIGVLGGGQLGRMLAIQARRMGYRVMMWTGGENSGAARLADHVLLDPFDSESAFQEFTSTAYVATVEFENIPRELIDRVATKIPVMPSTEAVGICQDREKEKKNIPGDVIIKTVKAGYDGKGQLLVKDDADRPTAEEIWADFGSDHAIVEKRINLAAELSVICVSGQGGEVITYDPAENEQLSLLASLLNYSKRSRK